MSPGEAGSWIRESQHGKTDVNSTGYFPPSRLRHHPKEREIEASACKLVEGLTRIRHKNGVHTARRTGAMRLPRQHHKPSALNTFHSTPLEQCLGRRDPGGARSRKYQRGIELSSRGMTWLPSCMMRAWAASADSSLFIAVERRIRAPSLRWRWIESEIR